MDRHPKHEAVSLQEFEAAREDIKNKNTEDLNVMKITLESTIDELEKKFEISHEAYLMQVLHCSLGGYILRGLYISGAIYLPPR
jgi:hypothetical protein